MRVSARSLVLTVSISILMILAFALPPSAHAQSCSGRCLYTIDCVKCGFSAFLRHICLVDEGTCECAEYPCGPPRPTLRSADFSTPAPAQCTAGFEAASVAPPLKIKTVKLKARS
jgi:hypothetical protein